MTLSDELREILVCPACKGELDFSQAERRLVCPACRLVFQVEDGIPNMLLEEATRLEG